ncbi:hypothetical protein T01_14600 [Trichinella spiralis]|uniref:Uncharacterized protein n=1 Tax=Trichinella spiralis TaxID=6334 RepID=A0A0V1BUI0_TRISP|nr:hypothetical protein T01_14600 [Trichinella spiralis]
MKKKKEKRLLLFLRGYFLEIFSTDCPDDDDDDDDDDDVMIVLMNSDGYNDFGINENEMITIIHSKHANDRLKCDGCLFDAGMEKKDKTMATCQSNSELLENAHLLKLLISQG